MDRYQFFVNLPRHEPGGVTFSSAYLSAVPLKATDRICEVGCGGGETTVWVARSRGSTICAVDDDRRYLAETVRRGECGGAKSRLYPVCADFKNLPFADESFTAVFAEATAMRLGLRQALTLWRRLVVPEGHLAVTYPGVLRKDAPAEVRGGLERRMAEPLGTLDEYKSIVKDTGFELVHSTPLQAVTWDHYYTVALRHAWALIDNGVVPEDDPTVSAIVEEANWFRRIGRGRVFFQALVCRRVR